VFCFGQVGLGLIVGVVLYFSPNVTVEQILVKTIFLKLLLKM
jgi:hypothetical protein